MARPFIASSAVKRLEQLFNNGALTDKITQQMIIARKCLDDEVLFVNTPQGASRANILFEDLQRFHRLVRKIRFLRAIKRKLEPWDAFENARRAQGKICTPV